MGNFFPRLCDSLRAWLGGQDHNEDEEKTLEGLRDTNAYHESLWKPGNIPANVRRPRTERRNINGRDVNVIIPTNLLVGFLGAPGVGVTSFINKARFGDMKRCWAPEGVPVFPPQYLCDGEVYNLGLGELPIPQFPRTGFAVDSDCMAVVLVYAIDCPSSFAEAQKLQQRLYRDTQSPEAPPFPVLLLGLKADLRAGTAGGCGAGASDPQQESEHHQVEEVAFVRDADKLERWAFAWSRNMLHAEASALTGDGVLKALGSLVEEVERMRKADPDRNRTQRKTREEWIPTVAMISTSARGGAGVRMPEEKRVRVDEVPPVPAPPPAAVTK